MIFSWYVSSSHICTLSLREGKWEILGQEKAKILPSEHLAPPLQQPSLLEFLWTKLATSHHMNDRGAMGVANYLGSQEKEELGER